MASILLFREKFPREARKNDVAHPGLARFANFFSLDSHATIEERNFPSRGERAPRKFRQRRALAACTRVNVRMSRLDLLVSLSSAARFACSNATLVAFRLTILSTKLRPVRRGNGTKEERRDGDGNEESNGLFQPGLRGPCGQEGEGTRRSSARERGEGGGKALSCRVWLE